MKTMDTVIVVLALLPIMPRLLAFALRVGEEIAYDGASWSLEWRQWLRQREARYQRHLMHTRREIVATGISLITFALWTIFTDAPRTPEWRFWVTIVCTITSLMLIRTVLRPNERHDWL